MSSTAKPVKRKKTPAKAKPPAKKKSKMTERIIEARADEEIVCKKLRVRRGERLVLRGAVRVDSVVVSAGGVLRYSDAKASTPRSIDNKGTIELVGGK